MKFRNSSLEADVAISAATLSQGALRLEGVARRHPGIVRRLAKYSLSSVAAALGGMLTRPELHPCTARLEALCHLAALACRGTEPVPAANLRDWLNGSLLADDVARAEDPVEDVFVSCVVSWTGTSRIFEGIWEGNDFYLQSCLAALNDPGIRSVREQVFGPVRALLRISDAVAARGGLPRHTCSQGRPRARIPVTRTGVAEHGARVTFDRTALDGMGIGMADLATFVFDASRAGSLLDQTIGHTDLERRPLVVGRDGSLLLALPTAVSAAIRRFVMEVAQDGGALEALQAAIQTDQTRRVHARASAGWEMRALSRPSRRAPDGMQEFHAEFDRGAFAQMLLVHDSLREAAADGLQGIHDIGAGLDGIINAGASELRARLGFRRGLTVVIHCGVGRGFTAAFVQPRDGWHVLPVSLHDFTLLARAPGFSAMRAWKILRQLEETSAGGVALVNPGGFVNLYGFAESHGFRLVPSETEASTTHVWLANDHVLGLRREIRLAYDPHAARSFRAGGWEEVERRSAETFFGSIHDLPFVVPGYASMDFLAGCVETERRTFWMLCDTRSAERRHRSLVFQVWDMALNWLPRCAGRFEDLAPGTLDLITFSIEFPDLGEVDAGVIAPRPLGKPTVAVSETAVRIGCDAAYLASFGSAKNLGDHWMVHAILTGAARVAGLETEGEELDALAAEIVGSPEARYFHTIPTTSKGEEIHATASLPQPRLVQPEDKARSRAALARLAGFSGRAGPMPDREASELLGKAVGAVWARVREVLFHIDRASVVTTALEWLEAVEKERAVWRLTASAVIALHGAGTETLAAATGRESDRAEAATSLRALVEMAICTAPLAGGVPCSTTDLDGLLADVAVLIETAHVKDALHYGVAGELLVICPDMTFGFEGTLAAASRDGYLGAVGGRAFLGAADAYRERFPSEGDGAHAREPDPAFVGAWSAEFGADLDGVASVTVALADMALAAESTLLRMPRSRVVDAVATALGADGATALRVVERLSLRPRARWDEPKPENASGRDWYPWKYGRRLSLIRRPLVQLTSGGDPDMVVSPALLERSVRHLTGAYAARIPGQMFDTEQMRRWIGEAANRLGHEFNHEVRDVFLCHGYKAVADVDMTRLGGAKELGDVDVLGWSRSTAEVFAVECKRLSPARTIGEIGEHLKEYTEVAPPGRTKTRVQRHLDRIVYLRSALSEVSRFTGIPADSIILRSCLVTHEPVPMQFSPRAEALVDVALDLDGLSALLAGGDPKGQH